MDQVEASNNKALNTAALIYLESDAVEDTESSYINITESTFISN
jgi:hypothetical protein